MQKYSDTHSNYAPPPPDSSSGMLVRVCRWRGNIYVSLNEAPLGLF